jgi:hypothetical protein
LEFGVWSLASVFTWISNSLMLVQHLGLIGHRLSVIRDQSSVRSHAMDHDKAMNDTIYFCTAMENGHGRTHGRILTLSRLAITDRTQYHQYTDSVLVQNHT